MTALAAPRLYTPEEYLELERAAVYKSEYVNGRIYAMSGASREHNLIAFNLSAEIRTQLKSRPCEAYGSDMRVHIPDTTMYTYPDMSIVCGEPQFADSHVDTLLNPTVLMEVLSPSTEGYDRGEKFAHYRRLASLQEYLLVSQTRARIERFVRQGMNWVLTEYDGLDATVPLRAIDCSLALREVYDKVQFPAHLQVREVTDEPR
jgi:Uma2 family endonuclease